MRRILTLSALTAAGAGLVPAAAEAGRQGREWQRVLAAHRVDARSERIAVRPGRIARTTVRVTVRVPARETEPVLFPDALYGATAWRWTGRAWRRVDSARVRPAVVRELAPGERAKVTLPLQRRARRIRVLVPVPADRAGTWADVRR